MKAGLVAILILAGCYPSEYSTNPHPMQRQALDAASDYVSVRFGKPWVYVAVEIRYIREMCPDEDIPHPCILKPYTGEPVRGLYFKANPWSPAVIYIAMHPGWRSTLAHELIHHYQKVYYGSSDGDHKNARWWREIDNIRNVMDKAGLTADTEW